MGLREALARRAFLLSPGSLGLVAAAGLADFDEEDGGDGVVILTEKFPESSNVYMAEYNRLTRTLSVHMAGGFYPYANKPESEFHNLCAAASKGSYVHMKAAIKRLGGDV